MATTTTTGYGSISDMGGRTQSLAPAATTTTSSIAGGGGGGGGIV
eukprot:CAMPEP_0118723440 /NCGR_PEP_ID=MMETSP0800-20121206/32003_1 /TAXON_ID=210618 ORGANISM="Striatella unipunctata, Strain CCMP2910" /NCGR_SAMPLE_ID=MMETSP0800 /ASSEMBLY_ACC=CAM_ASM_000638 /LENGTH=44 /DNA_ID= /DNA_START= /DNA_END= /DNA_ORIENTATION=